MNKKIWTIKELIDWSKEYFESKGVEEARLNIELILCQVLQKKRIDLYLNFDLPLGETELIKIREFVSRRAKREPLQYILGEVEFDNHIFKVDKRVLIPRPETEELVNIAKKLVQEKNYNSILDIGTGSGCIAISLQSFILQLNKNTEITAIDISDDALNLAEENEKLIQQKNSNTSVQTNDKNEMSENDETQTKIQNNINWVNIDLFDDNLMNNYFENKNKSDLIISNPPYINTIQFNELKPELIEYEPHIALTDFDDGLKFFRKIVTFCTKMLSYDGELLLEFGFNQNNQIEKMFSEAGFEVEIIKDFQGINRFAKINFKR